MIMSLKIPLGYKVIENEELIELKKVVEVFKNKGENYISQIKKIGENALVTRHRIRCPHCENLSGIYLPEIYEDVNNEPLRSEKEVEEWLSSENNLFTENAVMMSVSKLLKYSDEYLCEKCGLVSKKNEDFCELFIEIIDKELIVKRELKTLGEIADINWNVGELLVTFPMSEQLVFDFESGKVRIELISDKKVVSRVVTNNELKLDGHLLIDLISKNENLKRVLVKNFEEISGYKIPFELNELDFQMFVNLTFYNGFPKDFYDAIPFKSNKNVLDESFEELAEQLRNPLMAMNLLEKSTLPACKSIKKLFATRSGLFFYIKECEQLYAFFKDVNVLRNILSDECVFSELVDIHYHNCQPFFDDFGSVADKKMLVRVSKILGFLISYAIKYSSLSEYAKNSEKEKWSSAAEIAEEIFNSKFSEPGFSVPMHPVPANAKIETIGRYTFKWLRTKNEYTKAGKELENCLTMWYPSGNPVVTVLMDERMIASIEIEGENVIQARLKNNNSISVNSDLYKTICKWCGMQQINITNDAIEGRFFPAFD